MGKATQDLRNEHGVILRVMKIADKMVSITAKEKDVLIQHYGDLVYFLKIFADKCHHGKEEVYLFPELVKNGMPNDSRIIAELLLEHTLGREHIASMDKSLGSKNTKEFEMHLVKYRDLIREHIKKETAVLFTMADKILNDKKQDELFEKFEDHEENVIGHGVHEKLHSMIHVWEEAYK